MTETPEGPGWWQAADQKWYPPESHPNYAAPPGHSAPGVPQGAAQAPGGGAQTTADGLAAARNIAAKLSPTSWFLFAGFALAILATFFPLVTYSSGLLGLNSSFNAVQRLIVFVLVGVGSWLAWPLLSGAQIAVNRLVGLSVVDGLFAVLMLIWFIQVSTAHHELEGFVDVSPGLGLMMCGAAIVLIAVGVVRLWIQRSQTQQHP